MIQPLRGDVWDVEFPFGDHPAVVLTANLVAGATRQSTIAVVTGTSGPPATHIPLGPDAGLTRYDESYLNVASLHTLPHSRFTRQRGRLHLSELARVESALRVVLGLQHPAGA